MANSLPKKLWDKVPHIKRPVPEGWLTIAEFCERAGISRVQQVYKGINDGKISRKHLALAPNENNNHVVLIDWDSTAYDFIAARRQGSRPSDFKINDAREYKPFHRSAQQEIAAHAEQQRRDEIMAEVKGEALAVGDSELNDIVNHRLVTMNMNIPEPVDSTSTKHCNELVKFQKGQIELRKEANELITMANARSLLAGVAAEMSGAANRAIPAYSPILAAEENPIVVRQILKKIFAEVLRPIVEDKEDEDDKENGD